MSIEQPNFKDMDIAKLRSYATHLRLALARTDTKEDIVAKIEAKLKDKTMAKLSGEGDSIPPGHAEIMVLRDPMPGAENLPVYINANGYQATLPRGVKIIVPMRVLRILNDAVAHRRVQKQSEPGKPINEEVVPTLSYPYQVFGSTPGPEPLTKLEEAKAKTMGPRRAYRNLFGHWPKPHELRRAITEGLVTLGKNDKLQDGTATLNSEDMIDN